MINDISAHLRVNLKASLPYNCLVLVYLLNINNAIGNQRKTKYLSLITSPVTFASPVSVLVKIKEKNVIDI